MPKATVTSRVLKNKATGLEIQVPTFRVSKELLTTIVHYQVVLASNLACFKSPSHKESDVVQYSIERKLNEFEDLKSKLQGQFPGTMLPPINKKSIIVNDVVLRERRASLDIFMKSIASVPKMSTCVPLLLFLGVDRLRAKKFNRGEPLDAKANAPSDDHSAIGNTEEESESIDPVVFGDDDDSGNEDLFGDDDGKDRTDDMFGSYEEEEDDGDKESSRPGNVKVFEGQDLKRGLTEEDEKDFSNFIPDAILTRTEVVRTQEEEDNSELLEIEDDLDKLMTIKSETKKSTEDTTTLSESVASKPKLPSKPSPSSKPSIPSKPKPQIASKPKNLTSTPSADKPSVPQKPKALTSSTSDDSKDSLFSSSSASGGIGTVDNLDQDDIMKYLQDNLDSNAEEVDLFS